MSNDRTHAASLLGKMGLEVGEKMSSERLIKKLTHRLGKQGLPEDASQAEIDWAVEKGVVLATTQGKKQAETPPASEPKDKGKKKTTKKKTTEAADVAPEISGQEGKAKPKSQKPKGDGRPGGLQAFRLFFSKTSKAVPRDDVITQLVKDTGASHASIQAYISWAKREDNPFGFRLTESKDKEGKKLIKKL